ncbi:hypothetical protein CCMSSC00406_0010059 [Pleurotus cornucopiae]|uniref:Uncharacterized protein n=1 Tax=Pleurotus cornucopiae TaxID=5321 RepID=A0ACB7INW1_PLECO|nr:hypothetical protein CCMSSC00406_0010059 [Pleurotus cornucopiae]
MNKLESATQTTPGQVPKPPEPEVGSPDWFQQIIAPALGYSQLRDWQVKLAGDVFEGNDVVCVAGTGSGKSGMLHIPLMASKVAEKPTLGMSIAPTKSLCDDQARAANERGLTAVAVHSDSLREASSKGRDLFKEIFTGKWDLFVLVPELLHMKELESFFREQAGDDPEFAKLSLIFVDECHLVHEHGKEFRDSYRRIGRLSGRIPSTVPWIAATATLPPGELTKLVLQSLGFDGDDYVMCRMRVDVPNIKVVSRFLQHSISGLTMLDISWIIPVGLQAASSIKKTVVFCVTIKLAFTVMEFLQSLLPEEMSNREEVVMPFYSLMSGKYRERYIQEFREGTTRVLVGTDTLTCGMDVSDIEEVIILGVPPTPERLTQQIGRAGRNGKPARAIVYAPPWMNESSMKAADIAHRAKIPSMLCSWCNPSFDSCSRKVQCQHYGDEFIQPPHCCSLHEPDGSDYRKVEEWVEAFTNASRDSKRLRTKSKHRALDKTVMYPAAQRILTAWTRRLWIKIRRDNTFMPSDTIFPPFLRDKVCQRMHLVINVEMLRQLIPEWSYLTKYGEELVVVCGEILQTFDEVWKAREVDSDDVICLIQVTTW